MTHKHTPGPWEIRDNYTIVAPKEKAERWNNYAGNPLIVCDLEQDISDAYEAAEYVPFDNAQSNARLMVAAPELLEELEQSTREMELMLQNEALTLNAETREVIDNQITSNRTAIAKARGE